MKLKKNIKLILILILILCVGITSPFVTKYYHQYKEDKETSNEEPTNTPENNNQEESNTTTISINAVGDCTLNIDTNFNYGDRGYNKIYENKGADYFLGNFRDLFEQDDLTIANLEIAITDADESYRVSKQFNFKAPAEYLNILTGSSVDVVNIANNHIYDYGEKGYQDTKDNLNNAKLPFYGNDSYYIYEKDGIKIGMAGLYCAEDEVADCKPDTIKAINYLKSQNVDMIIMTYHWGIELALEQSKSQEDLAHYAIDNGVDLIIGHHTHCLQGIELYNGKYIVYSLGNFTFGGHWNPTYYETMVFHTDLTFTNNQLTDSKIEVIPALVSSTPKPINDYRPMKAEGEEAQKILDQIQQHSKNVTINK